MKNYQKNSSLNWWDLKSLLIMVIQKGNVHFKIIRSKALEISGAYSDGGGKIPVETDYDSRDCTGLLDQKRELCENDRKRPYL